MLIGLESSPPVYVVRLFLFFNKMLRVDGFTSYEHEDHK